MLNSAVIDGKSNLPCDISPASQDDSVALILWYKDDSLAPIYTIDARKANSLDKAKISIDEAYATRASFLLRSKPAQLQLENVRQEDEGDYRCRVDFKRGRTVNTIISLRVVVPPEDISIALASKPNSKLVDLIGPFNEGSELALVCMATGGKPRPQITWRRDYNVIDETYQHVDKTGTSVALRIPTLNKNHLLSIFTCQASNSNLTSPMETSITLDLNLKPQEISLRQIQPAPGEPLVIGQTVTFECLTHGSRPQATIHWQFQGSQHRPPMSVDQQQSSSRLTLNLQRSFNQQPLSCVAENPRIPSSAIRQTINLDVHYPPQLSIKIEPQSSPIQIEAGANSSGAEPANRPSEAAQTPNAVAHLQEGNDIYLTCAIDSNPRPMKAILWRFNGRPLQSQAQSSASAPTTMMIVMNNQSLVLRKISRQQSGSYTCEASNQHGFNASKPLELMVRHAPFCSTDDILVYEAAVGQTIALDCKIRANPSRSVHYNWFLAPNERNLSDWLQRDASLDEQIDESGSRLRFKIKDERNFGLLKCKAKNEIGLQQRPCLFQINPAPLPTLRHSCALLNASSTSLQLSCNLNEHLKSEDSELVKSGADASGDNKNGLRGWAHLEAIRNSNSLASAANHLQDSNSLVIPNSRLVFPPQWILAELYKLSETDTGDQDSSKLIAYVVVSSASQLANVKSLVEDNGLFKGNPKGVYYVMAKPSVNDSADSAHQLAAEPANGDNQIFVPGPTQMAGSSKYLIDASVQLSNSFVFVVPRLEPLSRYKLFIYGQNMANRTRDWTVVAGSTLKELSYASSASESAARSRLVGESLLSPADELNLDDDTAQSRNPFSTGQQKSLVMRSDSTTAADNSSSSLASSGAMQRQGGNFNGFQAPATAESVSDLDGARRHNSMQPAGPGSGFVDKQIEHLNEYKELAVYYAKQKPLLAVPMAVSASLVISLVIVWTVGSLIQFARQCGRCRRSSSFGSASAGSGASSGGKQVYGGGDGDVEGDKGDGKNKSGNQPEARSNGVQNGLKQQYPSAPGDSCQQQSSDGITDPASAIHSQRHQKDNAVFTIERIGAPNATFAEAASATHLGGNFGSAANGNVAALDDSGLFRGQLNNFVANQQFLGSLDRRTSNANQPIYLTEADSRLIQVHHDHYGHLVQQYGSVDRRRNPQTFMGPVSRRNGDQETLFVTDLSQLDPSTIYMMARRPQQVERYATANCHESVRCMANESFSSTDYSSDLNHCQGARAKQRVAFDLSHQESGPNRRAPSASQGLSRQPQQSSPNGPLTIMANKAESTSGSSSCNNSGVTADSGLESPPTNEGSNSGYLVAAGHAPTCSFLTSGASIRDNSHTFGGGQADCYSSDCQTVARRSEAPGEDANGGLVMFMELSPGSQESSTLLHSVDSFVEMPAVRLPENHHKLATSFGPQLPRASEELHIDCAQSNGQRDVNNWLGP